MNAVAETLNKKGTFTKPKLSWAGIKTNGTHKHNPSPRNASNWKKQTHALFRSVADPVLHGSGFGFLDPDPEKNERADK